MTSSLIRNGQLVRHTETALRAGSEGLGNVPALLHALLEEGAWREFVTQRGEEVRHATFSSFVIARPLKGLGADMDLIERVVGTADLDLLRLLEATKSTGQGWRADLHALPTESVGSYRSTNESGAVADRLHRDAPERYAAVKAGELSLNAAAVAAGIRPKRVSVRVDDPDSAARTLRKYMDPEGLWELVKLLES